MLFSRNGFKSVDTTEAFVKEALEFGNKDVVLSITHETGVIDIVFSPTMDAINAEVFHFLNDGTELKYSMPIKSLTNNILSTLQMTSAICQKHSRWLICLEAPPDKAQTTQTS
jgi:hypothetical protein